MCREIINFNVYLTWPRLPQRTHGPLPHENPGFREELLRRRAGNVHTCTPFQARTMAARPLSCVLTASAVDVRQACGAAAAAFGRVTRKSQWRRQ